MKIVDQNECYIYVQDDHESQSFVMWLQDHFPKKKLQGSNHDWFNLPSGPDRMRFSISSDNDTIAAMDLYPLFQQSYAFQKMLKPILQRDQQITKMNEYLEQLKEEEAKSED